MASTTARLGLTLPDPADTVDVTQLNADFTTIDNTVGFTPCTSSTRPVSSVTTASNSCGCRTGNSRNR